MRLATKAGHAVRVVQTPGEPRASWAARPSRASPARRCSSTSSSPIPRAAPSRAIRRPTTTRSPTSSWSRRCDVFAIAPGLGEHDRQARRRPGRQPAHERGARLRARRCVLAPAMNDRMWRAPGHPGRTSRRSGARRDDRGAGHRRARLEGRVGRWAGWPSPRRSSPRSRRRSAGPLRAALARRPARARHGRRHPRADRLGALRRQPLVGADGLRARRRGRPPRRRGDGGGRERRLPTPDRRRATWRWRRRRSSSAAAAPSFAARRRAADGGRRGRLPPGRARRRGKISKAGREGSSVELEPTADVLRRAVRRAPRDGQTLVGFAAEHGEGGARARAREARAQGARRGRGERHLARRHRLRLRRQRGHDRHARRASARSRARPRTEVAARDPRRGGGLRRERRRRAA